MMTAAAWDAAEAFSQDADQFALAAAAAAVTCLSGAVDIGLETVTLFGGIGYTWEHDTHLYWRRAMSLANLLGPRGSWELELGEIAAQIERHHDLQLDEPESLRGWVADRLGRCGGAARRRAAGLPGRPGPGRAALPAPVRDRGRPGGAGGDLAGVRARRDDSADYHHRRMGLADHPRARHGRAARGVRRDDAARRHHLVPALQRAGRGFGPRVAPNQSREGRRRLAAQRSEGLDLNAQEADWGICLARPIPRCPSTRA